MGAHVRTKRRSLHAVRREVAQALGSAGRKFWRREDLKDEDVISCDLVAEALTRIGRLLKGPDSDGAAAAIISSLEGLACINIGLEFGHLTNCFRKS